MTLPLGITLANLPAGDRVDIACAVVALISIGMGVYRGLSAELPLGVGLFSGLLFAWYAYIPARTIYQGLHFLQNEPEFLFLITAITVAMLAWVVSMLVSRGLRLLAVAVEKTLADHILGFVLGTIRTFLLLLIVTAVMLSQSWWNDGREAFCYQSQTGVLFTPWASRLLVALQDLTPHVEIHRRADPGDLNRP